MKIEIPVDDFNLILSDDGLSNDNFVEMWFEEKKNKHDDPEKEYQTFPAIDPLMVAVDDLLRAVSIFKKYE